MAANIDEVRKFLEENTGYIIDAISRRENKYYNQYENWVFDEDSFEVEDIVENGFEQWEVTSNGSFLSNKIIITNEGKDLSDDSAKCIIVFFVELDENGCFRVVTTKDKDGKEVIDANVNMWSEFDSCD